MLSVGAASSFRHLCTATQARIHRTAEHAVARKVLTQHRLLLHVSIACECQITYHIQTGAGGVHSMHAHMRSTVAVISLQRLADIPAPDEWRSCFRSCFLLIKLDDILMRPTPCRRGLFLALFWQWGHSTFNCGLAGRRRHGRRRRRWPRANEASSPTPQL